MFVDEVACRIRVSVKPSTVIVGVIIATLASKLSLKLFVVNIVPVITFDDDSNESVLMKFATAFTVFTVFAFIILPNIVLEIKTSGVDNDKLAFNVFDDIIWTAFILLARIKVFATNVLV